MPAAKFKGKEGAKMFFEFNINALEVIFFNANQFVEEGNTVIVLGNEHFITKENGAHLKNAWVQVIYCNKWSDFQNGRICNFGPARSVWRKCGSNLIRNPIARI